MADETPVLVPFFLIFTAIFTKDLIVYGLIDILFLWLEYLQAWGPFVVLDLDGLVQLGPRLLLWCQGSYPG